MRVRDWYLSGLSTHYRQTLILAAFAAPHSNALARAGSNHAGALRLAVEQPGVLSRVVPQVSAGVHPCRRVLRTPSRQCDGGKTLYGVQSRVSVCSGFLIFPLPLFNSLSSFSFLF
ncbi:hypothetical protein Vretimale_16454, partial [Volvox reticuliferus]